MTKLANPALYQAMQVVIDQGLRLGASAFTPGVPVWTPAGFDALRKHFVDQPDLTPGKTYLEKVAEQFQGAPNEAIQLMAELNYVHFLMPNTTSAAKKRENVHAILAMMQRPVAIPPVLDVGLEHGFINPGTYYLTNRPAQIAYLIGFGDAFSRLEAPERERLMADPWAFKGFAFSVPVGSAYAQREALLHLVFPETVTAITSRDHKQLIAQRFKSLVATTSDDVDQQLIDIQTGLAPQYGTAFSFYADDLQQLRDRLDAQGLVWAIAKYDAPKDWPRKHGSDFERWRGGVEIETDTFDHLASSLYLEASYLANVIELLRHKGQLIFHGPPGTVRAARRALDSPLGTHVLIVDEINRGSFVGEIASGGAHDGRQDWRFVKREGRTAVCPPRCVARDGARGSTRGTIAAVRGH